MTNERAVVVLIEFQNDLATPAGTLHDAIASVTESTMRTAYEKGYEVLTLTDCMAATSQEEHDNAIAKDFPRFSKTVTADEFIAQLRGAEAADTSRGY